jgi:hypothetical protein
MDRSQGPSGYSGLPRGTHFGPAVMLPSQPAGYPASTVPPDPLLILYEPFEDPTGSDL